MTNPYLKVIRAWDWDSIVAQCRASNEADEEGNPIGTFYVGSMPWPSGKYYLPFACSNVDACPRCKGKGQSTQPAHLWPLCTNCKGTTMDTCQRVAQATGETVEEVRLRLEGKHTFVDEFKFVCWSCQGKGRIQPECKKCGGLGSEEAYLDQEWYAAVDLVAGEYGCWTMNGDGDPCDFFIVMTLDKEETEEA